MIKGICSYVFSRKCNRIEYDDDVINVTSFLNKWYRVWLGNVIEYDLITFIVYFQENIQVCLELSSFNTCYYRNSEW